MKRQLVKRALAASRLTALRWRHLPPALYCFNYHRVGDPQTSPYDRGVFSCTAQRLQEHLAFLAERFEVINLERLLNDKGLHRATRKPCALITFDDGYQDNYTVAYPLLRAAGLTAVFFLPTGFVGSERVPWWDEIAWAMRHAIRPSVRLHGCHVPFLLRPKAIEQSIGDVLRLVRSRLHIPLAEQIAEIREACGSGPAPVPIGSLFLRWEQAAEMHNAGMDIGSHTHSHPILAQQDAAVQTWELAHSKDTLEKRLGMRVTAIAYPNGDLGSYTPATTAAAAAAGYKLGFNYLPQCNRLPLTTPFHIGRFAIEGNAGLEDLKFRVLWESTRKAPAGSESTRPSRTARVPHGAKGNMKLTGTNPTEDTPEYENLLPRRGNISWGKALKCWAYRCCKRVGLFTLARWLTARQLRILCFHGLSFVDEHEYSPGLFMRPDTIRSRLAMLTHQRYPILALEEALQRLRAGTLPACATVLTYDDGFFGNFLMGRVLLEEFPLPTTIYVTTYYVVNQMPIFRHVVQYMFWKTRCAELCLAGLAGAETGVLRLADGARRQRVLWQLVQKGEALPTEAERVALCRELGLRLGIDYEELARSRRFSLMNADEIKALAQLGVDIQLHTHRHRFPQDEELVRREIVDNRAVLERIAGRPCNHLCYPSGEHSPKQWSFLATLGVSSATTCEVGTNSATTPLLGLHRFLDSENVQPIEFEAELSGFAELTRRLRKLVFLQRGARQPFSSKKHGADQSGTESEFVNDDLSSGAEEAIRHVRLSECATSN